MRAGPGGAPIARPTWRLKCARIGCRGRRGSRSPRRADAEPHVPRNPRASVASRGGATSPAGRSANRHARTEGPDVLVYQKITTALGYGGNECTRVAGQGVE